MDSGFKLYLERAGNELRLARAIKKISEDLREKENLGLKKEDTFYSAVISHCYYSIFYSAKSLLLTINIKTNSPEVHRKTFNKFKENFIDTGVLDRELFSIYNDIIVKADELLDIFKDEKWKRGHFTYHTIAQANIEPAKESIENTIKFLANIKAVIEKEI